MSLIAWIFVKDFGISSSMTKTHSIKVVTFISAASLAVSFLASCTKFSSVEKVADSSKAEETGGSTGVIYGRDSRSEVHYVPIKMVQQISNLSVALIMTNRLKSEKDTVEIIGENLQESENLCSSEKFIEQRTSAYCSGVLIDATHVLTAGHCVFTQKECDETSFVFGYEYYLGSIMNYKVPKSNVYSCARIVAAAKNAEGTSEDKLGFDFSIIELDRAFPAKMQIAINVNDDLKRGDGLFTIGYPVGLPKKFADGVVASNSNQNLYFRASLDTYGGNSGSPVFNTKNGGLEGILISGEDDFMQAPEYDCRVSHKCTQGSCTGEQVLKMSKIKKYLAK